jgi:hypothetical protein
MKDLSLSIVGVLLIALAIALAFHWIYPLVDVGANLAGLFVFVAVVIKLSLAWLWKATHKPPQPAATGETAK